MQFFKKLVLPPGCLVLLALLSLPLRTRRPRLARTLAVTSLLALFLLSQPFVAAGLIRGAQHSVALSPKAPLPAADAIVILAAGLEMYAPDQGGPTLDALSLERLRYGAQLARRSGLPVLVAGGRTRTGAPALARLMATVLEQELGVAPRWIEDGSLNTRENATRSSEMLRQAGARRVLLVTHAFHMPRAERVFRWAGLEVSPAPTGFRAWPPLTAGSFVPSAESLQDSHWACHELLGTGVVRPHGRLGPAARGVSSHSGEGSIW